MQWNSSLSVGDALVDEQHKRLFNLLESLEHVAADENTGQVHAAVAELNRYICEHLRDEEAVLKSFRYKDYEAHCALHHEFELRLEALSRRLSTEDHYVVLQDLRDFVQTWLVQHISFVDLRFKPYLLS